MAQRKWSLSPRTWSFLSPLQLASLFGIVTAYLSQPVWGVVTLVLPTALGKVRVSGYFILREESVSQTPQLCHKSKAWMFAVERAHRHYWWGARSLTNVQPTHQGLWHEAESRASKRLKERSREEKGVLAEGQLTPMSPAGVSARVNFELALTEVSKLASTCQKVPPGLCQALLAGAVPRGCSHRLAHSVG